MRTITGHEVNELNSAILIEADERGSGNASHYYRVRVGDEIVNELTNGISLENVTEIKFQNGPIGEVGFNGLTNEALLAIVKDRLEGLQSGPYACDEIQFALDSVANAIEVLHSRTKARQARGVEGTHKV